MLYLETLASVKKENVSGGTEWKIVFFVRL